MNGRLYESEYEESVMQLLADYGWTATHGGEMTNRKLSEALIEDDLRSYLQGRYAQEALGDDEADGIIANLRNTGGDTLYHTLRSVVSLYRDGYSFHRYHTDEDLFVGYIDFMHPERNVFRCVNQYVVSYNGGRDVRIPDVLLFVNGIPVCIIELKNPTDYNATIAKAYDQIHIRYRRDIPHLMKYCALSCISDGSNTRLGTTYTPYIHYYAWKKVHNEDKTAGTGLHELHTLRGVCSGTAADAIARLCVFPRPADPQRRGDSVPLSAVLCHAETVCQCGATPAQRRRRRQRRDILWRYRLRQDLYDAFPRTAVDVAEQQSRLGEPDGDYHGG